MSIEKSSLRKAEKLVAQGKIKPAIDAYLKALRDDPDDANVNNILGDLYVRHQQPEKALPYFRRAARGLESSGFRTKAIATLRKAYRQSSEDPDIAEELANLLKLEGLVADARSVLFELAVQHEKAGKLGEAKQLYYKVLDVDPHHVQSLIKIGEIASREGDVDEEGRIYCRVINNLSQSARYEEAVDMLDNLDSRFRDHPEINKLKADIYVRVGRAEEAQKLLSTMRDSYPDDPAILNTMAQVSLRKGNIDEAEALYNKLTSISSKDESTDLLGAGIHIAREYYDHALSILQPHIEAILETKKESSTIIAIEEIVKRDPANVGALKKLHQIYTYLKDKQNLVRIVGKLSEAYEAEGDYKLSIDAVEQLIGLEPEKLAHKNRLEHLYEVSGGAAMFDSENVVVEDMELPESLDFTLDGEENQEGLDPQVHRHLVEAGVFLKFGLTQKARGQLEKAIDIDEFEPRIYEKSGEIYLEENETASAIQAYEKAQDCWRRRNETDKADALDQTIKEIKGGQAGHADVVIDELPEDSDEISLDFADTTPEKPKTDEEKVKWMAQADPLQGKLAEAEYYIEQNFITAAQHLLEKLEEQYPGNDRVSNLRQRLEFQLKSEMDITSMEEDLDEFFSSESAKKPQEQPDEPAEAAGEPSEFQDMINLLEDEISEIGSLADKKAGELTGEQDQTIDRLVTMPGDEDYVRTALQEDAGKHFDMGVAYFETGLYDEAITSFKVAVENPRYYQKACLQLGMSYLSKGMENVAVTWLQKCFTSGGNEDLMADALHQIAIIYQMQGLQDAFLHAVEQLESLAPKYPALKTLKSLAASMQS